MKKVFVMIISLVIIGISLFFINKLLSPDNEDYEVEESTTISYGDYELFNFDTNFNVYSLKDPSNFHIVVQNINIDYQEGSIVVAERVFDEVQTVYSYFAIYGNSVVVMAYKDINESSHVIMYDTYTSELEVIDKIDSFYVTIDENIIFENVGIIINTTKIKSNKIIGTNNDICKIKDQDMLVSQTYEIYYDSNTKKFSKNESLYSLNLYSYISNNNLCKE